MSSPPPPSSPDAPVNFAHLLGYDSVAAAVIFAIAYVPLFIWFVIQSFRIPTYVHYVLVFFCSIRVAAFVIRAILAGSDKAGETLGLVIADEVLIGVGFFGLLYSAYTLVLDREDLLPPNRLRKHPILQLISNRRLFRLTLSTGVVLGIVAASKSTTGSGGGGSNNDTSNALRKASVAIFLVLSVLQAILTVNLARNEMAVGGIRGGAPLTGGQPFNTVPTNDPHSVSLQDVEGYQGSPSVAQSAKGFSSIGVKHGVYILLAISLLIMVREVFSVATVGKQRINEGLWYLLTALPEVLAVTLYATPGLVPHAR